MKIMPTVLTLIKKNTFLPEIAHMQFSKEIRGTHENTAGHRYGTETSVPLGLRPCIINLLQTP